MKGYTSKNWHIIEERLPLTVYSHFHLGKVLDKYHKTTKRGSIKEQQKCCKAVVDQAAKTKETLYTFAKKKGVLFGEDEHETGTEKQKKRLGIYKSTGRFLSNLEKLAKEQLQLLKTFDSFGDDLRTEIRKLQARLKACKPGSDDTLDIYVGGLNKLHGMLTIKSKVPGIGAMQLKELQEARKKCNATEDTCEDLVKKIAKKPDDPSVVKKNLGTMNKAVADCLKQLSEILM